MLTTHRPDEGCPHGVFARPLVAAMQDGVVDLDFRVLHLEGHHVKNMLQLVRVRHKRFAMLKPRCYVTGSHLRACIAPAVAVQIAITGDNDSLACGIGDANKCLCSIGLAVLIKANRRFDLGILAVDGLARDVTEKGVEC